MKYDIAHLAHGDDRSPRQRDQVLGTRARKAGRVANDSQIVATWTGLTIAASNATAVDKMRTLLNDANTAVNVQSENVNASVVETGMETENGIGITASANETLSGIETADASVNGTAIGRGTVTVTAKEVTGTDETKRIGIGRAGKIAKSAAERCCPLKIVTNPLVWDIAPPRL